MLIGISVVVVNRRRCHGYVYISAAESYLLEPFYRVAVTNQTETVTSSIHSLNVDIPYSAANYKLSLKLCLVRLVGYKCRPYQRCH